MFNNLHKKLMNESVISKQNTINKTISYKTWLTGAVKSWVGVILVGQWMFALYILAQFSLPWISGQLDESQFSHMIRGYRNGDVFNNAVLLLHVIPVMLISLSATFQLFPSIRSSYPKFHRWNGRIFLFFGFVGAISGLYMTWIIGSRLSDLGALGVTLNGILIPIFVYFAWRTAVQKNVSLHRRLAVHAFILINGVWSVRLYLMAWFMVNQGPLGNSAKIDGPADIAISFASFIIPMAVAELVFWSERRTTTRALIIAAVAVSLAVLITLLGVYAASTMMWLPRITATF
ncbi:DUF2306 domain-containing protein [Thalassotalea ponticola]|uniref:DUF2306 domain-containing protein n=1 Tax=Thalassotalea ponticola TaxID=1523392 RepID=UPI0025B33CA0|nr:DUF2306 domain-containing protein [Thalassotalea ponticola]MDN3651990.1 DUF2306 domain-containing protein [Thalassotalea ponticola]